MAQAFWDQFGLSLSFSLPTVSLGQLFTASGVFELEMIKSFLCFYTFLLERIWSLLVIQMFKTFQGRLYMY